MQTVHKANIIVAHATQIGHLLWKTPNPVVRMAGGRLLALPRWRRVLAAPVLSAEVRSLFLGWWMLLSRSDAHARISLMVELLARIAAADRWIARRAEGQVRAR